jgi:hypothetical protein
VPEPPVLAPDRGDFKLSYEKTSHPDFRELQGLFRQSHLLDETLRALNETLALPRDVKVALRECGTADARYDASGGKDAKGPAISICYELVAALADLFAADAKTDEEAQQAGVAVAGATLYVLFQETGRALLDLYALPAPGKPEDAVDQLATLVLLASGDQGEQMALNGAQAILGEEGKTKSRERLKALPYWRAHGLDEARLYAVLCWVYGKNPLRFQDLVGDGTLPRERAARCPEEYQRLEEAWQPVLAPYLKVSPRPPGPFGPPVPPDAPPPTPPGSN